MLSIEDLLIFVDDMSWALMLLVTGSPYRALHSLQTYEFPVPMGFNTPVDSDHWMSYGPLGVRRAILAVLASLILPESLRNALTSDSGKGVAFWKSLRALQSKEQRRAFRDRTDRWSAELLEATDFY